MILKIISFTILLIYFYFIQLSLLQRKGKGEKIFNEVCDHLDLQEKDYFGLSFRDKAGRRTWLDLDKRVGKVLKGKKKRVYFLPVNGISDFYILIEKYMWL